MYFLTGSQQFHLIKNASESLVGRIGILQLMGLSLRESGGDSFTEPFIPTKDYITKRNKNAKTYTPRELWGLMHRGSFPAVASGYTERNGFYDTYIRTYVERDVRSLGARRLFNQMDKPRCNDGGRHGGGLF
jgi:predicted AAA+ superfamily ATPase